MVENEQNEAVTTLCKNCCSTGLGKMEVGPDEEERQFIVENITESSESSCSYENSRSRLVILCLNILEDDMISG